MRTIIVALASHVIKDPNLGCGALAISNIHLLDKVFTSLGYNVHYVVAITNNLEQINLSQYTKYTYEYRIYPRCRETIKNPMRLLNTKVFEGCDIVFNLCGGDGYTDIYGFGRLLAESQLVWVAKKNGIPIIYSPQTIGPFNTKKGLFVAKKTLNQVRSIYVRDHKSYDCCVELGLENKTTEVIDVAFALPYVKKEFIHDKINIGINVSGLLYNGGYNRKNYFDLSFSYKEFIHKMLVTLSKNDNYRIFLIPHVITDSNEIEDDYRVCAELSERYNLILAPKFNSPIEAKSYISGMDFFTGARMHSTIAATSSGVPVVPVAYSRKFNGLYESLNYKWVIDARSSISSSDAVDLLINYLSQVDNMKKDIDVAASIYKARLDKYHSYMNELIKDVL